jgi:predicted Ser/Thr protein kinase
MAPPGICPQCGERLPADVPHGICPKCMLSLGFDEPGEGPEQAFRPTREPARRSSPPLPSDLAAHFPQLEVLELLGQGGMGAVYRARQKTLDRVVALKVLSPEVGQDPAFAERFTREAQALARLTHPNIVMVFDFGETSGYYFFIMEYVDGVNLRQSLHAGRLTPEQALAIVPQVCEALQYAHDQGIVHRDIKPENVLLDKRGRVKIADFGLAKLLGRPGGRLSLTGTGQVMGTPHYMAPEQMEKPLTVDHRADIYSLGVVFYELLTGELPIGRFAPPSQKTNVSVDLDQVVLRTLEKEPERRYQQASEVKTAVESLGTMPGTFAQVAASAQTRVRVPFTIDDVYGGLARADGILRFDGRELTLEFQVKDDVVGYVASGVKIVAVPLSEVVSLEWVPGWFGRKTRLELRADTLHTLRDVPRSERGIVGLRIARNDVPFAQQIADAVRDALAPTASESAAAVVPAKPPLPGEDVNWSGVAHSMRGPAIGLTVVGILDCLAIVLLLLLFPVMTVWRFNSPRPSIHVQAADSVPGDRVAVTSESVQVFLPGAPLLELRQTSRAMLTIVIVALVSLVPLVFVVIMIVGAARMRHLETYGLAMTASILAILPVHPAFVLGLPIGIWALVVLMRRDTREAFRLRERLGPSVLQPGWTVGASAQPLPAKPPREDAPNAWESLRIPATGLMIVGILNIGGCALVGLFAPASELAIIPLALLLLPTLAGLFQIQGGWHMFNGRSHTISMLGVVAAWLPVSPLWIVSLPLGIWALMIMQRHDVKALFADQIAGANRDRGNVPTTRPTRHVPVVVVVVSVLVAAAILSVALLVWAYLFSRVEHQPMPSPHVIQMPVMPQMPTAPPISEPPPRTLIAPAAPIMPEKEI